MKNLRLYSPAKVTTYEYDEYEMCYANEPSDVYYDVEYFKVIKDEIKRYTEWHDEDFCEQGLMAYFDGEGEIFDSLIKKVESALPSVTVLTDKNNNEKLFGVCDLKINEELTKEELAILYVYLEGCFSDGFGEGFEQQNIKPDIYSDEIEIQMHFWESGSFYIKTEEEIKNDGYTDLYPPKQEEVVQEVVEEEFEQDYSNDEDFEMSM